MVLAQSTLGRFSKILVEVLQIDPTSVELSANLQTDLGIDSLDELELIWECEEEFGFDISENDDAVQALTTVEQVVAYLDQRLAAKAAATSPPHG